jgi:hypothetical protein
MSAISELEESVAKSQRTNFVQIDLQPGNKEINECYHENCLMMIQLDRNM